MTEYFITTEENWRMRVSYIVNGDTPDEAIKKIRSGEVPITDSDNLEVDEILEIITIEKAIKQGV